MMATPAMEAALKQRIANLFGALRIDLPGHTIRVLDGAGALSFDGGSYTGRDATYGVLSAIEAIGDGMGDEAPALSFTFLPASTAAAADLTSPTAQGSAVKVVVGAFVPESGSVIADPIVQFLGVLDQATLTIGKGARSLDFDCVSAFEYFFDNQEGVRLAPAWHKAVWAGETGLDNITGVQNDIYWGQAAPKGSVSYAGGGGGAGGGFNQYVQLR
jgi:hypothetical protein